MPVHVMILLSIVNHAWLGRVRDVMQCQCPRQPSLPIKSRAWLLDTGGDLLVRDPCRLRTTETRSLLCVAIPLLCCKAGVASPQGVLPDTCREQWLPCPFHHLLRHSTNACYHGHPFSCERLQEWVHSDIAYIPLSVGLQWYHAVRYGRWMGILQWGRTVHVQLWTIVHKHSVRQALVPTNHTVRCIENITLPENW